MGGQTIAPVAPEPRSDRIETAIVHLRETARDLRAEADRLARDAAAKRAEAFGYERRADAAERELLGRAWDELRPGDAITLRVFDMGEGWVREKRDVVAVNWPVLTLRDGDREYDFDASSDTHSRDVRLVA